MQGKLYKCFDEVDRLRKNPKFVKNLSFNIKGELDMLTPIITLKKDTDLLICNYISIDFPGLGTMYYFISKQRLQDGGIMELELTLDSLYSFQNVILNSIAFVERCEDSSKHNKYLNDALLPILTKRKTLIKKDGFNQFDSNLKNYIVVTGGGVQ